MCNTLLFSPAAVPQKYPNMFFIELNFNVEEKNAFLRHFLDQYNDMLYTLPLFDFIVSVRRFSMDVLYQIMYDVHHYNRCRLRNSWIRFF